MYRLQVRTSDGWFWVASLVGSIQLLPVGDGDFVPSEATRYAAFAGDLGGDLQKLVVAGHRVTSFRRALDLGSGVARTFESHAV